jgi:hypothetical protein
MERITKCNFTLKLPERVRILGTAFAVLYTGEMPASTQAGRYAIGTE